MPSMKEPHQQVADNAMRSIGFPMSPFELLDLVGPGVAAARL